MNMEADFLTSALAVPFVYDRRVWQQVLETGMKGKDKATWTAMTAAEQAAAAKLGYDGDGWDAGVTPPACQQHWHELLSDRSLLAAAEVLGYTQSDWDAELDELLRDADDSDVDKWPAEGSSSELATTYRGVTLILSGKSGTGYKGVCQRGHNRFAVTYKGKCEGSFSTAIEAAARYAELTAVDGGEDAETETIPVQSVAACLPSTAAKSAGQTLVTHAQGLKLHMSPDSQTGYKGVGKQNNGSGKQFQAHIGHGPGSSLGYFATAVEAAVAYARKVKEMAETAVGKGGASQGQKRGAQPSDGARPAKHSKGGIGSRDSKDAGSSKGVPPLPQDETDDAYVGGSRDVACHKCLRRGDAFRMLLCDGDGCNVAQHTYCCEPPLLVAPAGDWYCFSCTLKRQATHNLTGRQQMKYLQQLEEARTRAEDEARHSAAAEPKLDAERGAQRTKPAAAKMATPRVEEETVVLTAGEVEADPVQSQSHGIKLYLSSKSQTGYYKVTTDYRGEGNRNLTYRAFRIAHPKTGGFIGRYATAVEAAVEVARDARDRGLPHAAIQAALDKGLKGQELIETLERAKDKVKAKGGSKGKG